MASFLDTPKTFNPYVKTLPVEAMVGVGNLLQAKFDQGLQKVQGAVDHIATLPVAREVDKQYVQSALNSLKEGIQGSAIADFSNSQLVNQIGGAASKIVNDPIIQKSISSAMRVKSGYTQLEDAKKTGKGYSVENEWYFNNSVQGWMNSQDLQQGFEDSYMPYVDIVGAALEMYKAMPESENIERDAFRIDGGQVKYNSALIKGKSAQKIQDAIDLVMQRGDVQKQLHVSGQYKFQGIPSEQMYNNLTIGTSTQIEAINDRIKSLQSRITTDNTANPEQINTSLSLLRNQAAKLRDEYKGYVDILNSNPEALKAQLVKNQISTDFIGAFTSEIAVENPLWKGYMEEASAQLAKEKFIWEQFDDNRKFELDEKKFGLEVQKELRAATEKAKKKEGEIGYSTVPGVVSEEAGRVGITSFKAETDARVDAYNREMWVQANILAAEAGIPLPGKENPDGSISPNVGSNPATQYTDGTKAYQQVQKLLQDASQGMINGQPTTVAKTSYQKLRDMKENVLYRQKIKKDIDSQFLTRLTASGVREEDVPYHLAAIAKNKGEGWEEAESQLKQQYGSDWESKLGIGSYSTPMGAQSAPGFIPSQYIRGDNYSRYKQATKSLSGDLKNLLSDRDVDYKNAQAKLIAPSVQLNYGKQEEELAIKQAFGRVIALGTRGKEVNKGDFADLSDLLKKDDKDNPNDYFTDFDETTGMGSITVRRGAGTVSTIDGIPRGDYFTIFPQLQQDNSFNQKFRNRLELNNWKSTDRFNDGRKDAYILDVPPSTDPNNNYSVQYHLIEGTSPGTYRIRLWVADKSKPTEPIIDGRAFDNNSESGAQMDRAQVMGMLEWLKNPTNLQIYINSKQSK